MVSVPLTEALLQKEKPFPSKGEKGARTERQIPSCSSGQTSRAVRRRRRVWERQRLACDLGVKESTVEQDQ